MTKQIQEDTDLRLEDEQVNPSNLSQTMINMNPKMQSLVTMLDTNKAMELLKHPNLGKNVNSFYDFDFQSCHSQICCDTKPKLKSQFYNKPVFKFLDFE